MDVLKQLNLTEDEFKMIVDGLDQLPNKGNIGDMMIHMLTASMSKDNPEAKAKMEAELEKESRKKELEKEILIENIKILQGKLLLFKRFLQQEGALQQAKSIATSKEHY